MLKVIYFYPYIGVHYKNPSFGLGGYCFIKNTKQLITKYRDVNDKLINTIVELNITRKDSVADTVITLRHKAFGGASDYETRFL